MKIQLDDNSLKAVNKTIDLLGMIAFSSATGGVVALSLSVGVDLDSRINIIIGAMVALIPPVVEWAKKSLIELETEQRRWEEIRLNAEIRERAELERAKNNFRLEAIREENEHERSMWSARNTYLELSNERQRLSKS